MKKIVTNIALAFMMVVAVLVSTLCAVAALVTGDPKPKEANEHTPLVAKLVAAVAIYGEAVWFSGIFHKTALLWNRSPDNSLVLLFVSLAFIGICGIMFMLAMKTVAAIDLACYSVVQSTVVLTCSLSATWEILKYDFDDLGSNKLLNVIGRTPKYVFSSQVKLPV